MALAADGKNERLLFIEKLLLFLLGGYFFVGQHNNAMEVQIKNTMHIACPCEEYCC